MQRPHRRAGIGCALAVALALGACSGSDGGAAVEDLTVTANPANVVSATASFDGPSGTITVRATSGDHVVEVVDDAAERGRQEVDLVGLRPDRTYDVVATPDGGEQAAASFTTGPLPEGFPPIETIESDGEAAAELAAGWTLFNARRFVDGGLAPVGPDHPPGGYAVAVDEAGEVVWYVTMERPINDIVVADSGNVLVEYDGVAIREVDPMGEIVREWTDRQAPDDHGADAEHPVVPVDVDVFHHEIVELDDQQLLAMGMERRDLTSDMPRCDEDPATFDGTYDVIGDTIVVFDRESGDITWEWSLLDHVDPFERPGVGLCAEPGLLTPFPEAPQAIDWSHGNAVVVDDERNELVVSLRHLDAVLGIRFAEDADGPAGEMLWELGRDGTIVPEAGSAFFQQHAPELGADGTIVVYDNGVGRTGADGQPMAPPPYSRAVTYAVDRDAGTAEQVSEVRRDGPAGPVYSPFLGDVDLLDTGNLLVTDGAQVGFFGEVVEVTPDGDVLRTLRVRDDVDGWGVYRAERIAPLG